MTSLYSDREVDAFREIEVSSPSCVACVLAASLLTYELHTRNQVLKLGNTYEGILQINIISYCNIYKLLLKINIQLHLNTILNDVE
jgi:hypothetical protein